MGRFKQHVIEQEEEFWNTFWYYMTDDPELRFDDLVKTMQSYEHLLVGDSINNRMWEMKKAFDDHVKGEQP